MTLAEFEQQVFAVAMASPICGILIVRRLTPTSINLRIDVTAGGFIDAFYNEQTGTTAFALIRQGRRAFGADNTGGWHVHPLTEPDRHYPLSDAMSFADFVAEIERHQI
jgi:Ethanolamine utilization protein EutJ (predicted chaperonin)